MKKQLKKITIMVVCISMGLFSNACAGIKSLVKDVAKEAMQETKKNASWEENINYMYRSALESGNTSLVADCWENGADKNSVDGVNPVYIAIANKHNKLAMWLLAKGCSPDYVSDYGEAMVTLVASSWDYALCKKMIDCGADLNYVNKQGMTVLESVIDRNSSDLSIIRLFVEAGASITKKAVNMALEQNKGCDVGNYLVAKANEKGVKLNLNPAVEAAVLGNTEKVRDLIGKKLSGEEKKYVLAYTAAFGSSDTLKVLEKAKYNYEKLQDDLGVYDSELGYYAAVNGNQDTLQYLLETGAFSMKEDEGGYYLYETIKAGQAASVQMLLEHGAKANTGDDVDDYAREAAAKGSFEIVQQLVEKGYDVNANDRLYYALEDAAKNNQLDFIKHLTEQGYDCNMLHSDGDMAVIDNAQTCSVETLQYLIEQGAPVNGTRNNGEPLNTCIEGDCTEEALMLIEAGADVSLTPKGKDTNLMYAVNNGNLELVKALLEHGADINEPSFDHYPVIDACNGHTLLAYLIEQGADVNVITEEEKNTALMTAAYYGNIKGVQILLDTEEDLTVKDVDGKTAYDQAVERKNVRSAELIAEAMEGGK